MTSEWQLQLGRQDPTQLGKTASSDQGKPQGRAPRFRVQLILAEDSPDVPLSATRATAKQPA